MAKNSLASAALLMLATRFIVNGLGIVSSLILVRLLSPEDFGIAAIAMSIYAFISLFGEFGLNTALIQKVTPSKTDYDAAFTVNLLFAIFASLTFILASDYFALFFNNDSLSDVFKVLGTLFLINGFQNIKIINFQINMDFASEMKFQVIPKLLSFVTTLILAFSLKNYWALVIGSIMSSVFIVTYSYIMTPYLPSLTLKGTRALFSYSKWLMLNNFLLYLNTKSVDLLVGKLISTPAAGVYSISKEMSSIPSTEIAAPINKASFPAYSKAKNDRQQLKILYYKTKSMITMIALPASLGLFVTADYFVPVVLGEKWLSAVPVIMALSVVSFLSSLASNNGYIFMAIGKPQVTTILSGFRFLLFIALLLSFGLYSTMVQPAIALGISALVNLVLSYAILKLQVGVSLREILKSVYRPLLGSLTMLVSVKLVAIELFTDINILSLLVLVLTGIVVYSITIILLWFAAKCPDTIERQMLIRIKEKVSPS